MNYSNDNIIKYFPSTRYQGSKRKLLPWIYDAIKDLDFENILDAFGGSASVSLLFKRMGKTVTYNDILKFNSIIGDSVIANSKYTLSDSDLIYILNFNIKDSPNNFISKTFCDIYYIDEENIWLDNIIYKINSLQNLYEGDVLKYKQAIAYNALFQSCLIKRPYNLFHRKNLYMRTRQVARSFGNKKTWDKPFEYHFKKFVQEINNAVFDSGVICYSTNLDIFDINSEFDAVYIDPPYVKKTGTVDYLDYYHFLEGMIDYDSWNNKINTSTMNKRLVSTIQNRFKPSYGLQTFEELISKFQNSKLIISYKDGGIPSIETLIDITRKYKKNIKVHKTSYKYALNKNNNDNNCEYLIIGE